MQNMERLCKHEDVHVSIKQHINYVEMRKDGRSIKYKNAKYRLLLNITEKGVGVIAEIFEQKKNAKSSGRCSHVSFRNVGKKNKKKIDKKAEKWNEGIR